ncbi:GLPGLI family protein [Chryseobacterium sp. SC28]|uniref:GLPGLI family protein n=1 Tax=Chryseobacterium sp. SC28 TaxID=2268028 RepID=UPI001629E345|nr:GLPGLI family protein [Chryseobacterium sp. SC28]
MKKYIQNCKSLVLFINIAFIISYCNFYGQVKITYEVSYKPDSTNEKRNIEEMTLKCYEGESYFYNETKFKLDSIYDRVTSEFIQTGIAPKVSLKYELNFGIFKNFSKREFLDIHNISSRNFAYKDSFPKLQWQVSNSKKEILNYFCKSATVNFGGRVWEAWFTDEIPINDGPYKFFGLPGLILEIYDLEDNYHFVATSILKQNEKIEMPSSTIKTSKEQFLKIKENLIKDPALYVRESVMKNNSLKMKDITGATIEPMELYQRITKEFNFFKDSHNNPIEKATIWIK